MTVQAAPRGAQRLQALVPCVHRQKAKLWPNTTTYDASASLAQNVQRFVKADFAPFAAQAKAYDGKMPGDDVGAAIDTIAFDVPDTAIDGSKHANVERIARTLLTALHPNLEQDLARFERAPDGGIYDPGAATGKTWELTHAGTPFFVVTFASCYPKEHSRYAHRNGATTVLVQVLASFPYHLGLGASLQAGKDESRAAFTKRGQPYDHYKVMNEQGAWPLSATRYVKPLDANEVRTWWCAPDSAQGLSTTSLVSAAAVGLAALGLGAWLG